MKSLALFTAALAVIVSASAQAAPAQRAAKSNAEPVVRHDAGGPLKQGNKCWVYTDSRGAGFWDACDSSVRTPRGISLRGRSESEIIAIESGGGGDGGGGGGGGGGR